MPRTDPTHLLPGRFALLMALYEDNYRKLKALFPHARHATGVWCSALRGAPPLVVQVIAQERHTSVLLLNHRFERGATPCDEPCAYVRVYHDTRQAEVTHFQAGADLHALFRPDQDQQRLAWRRVRMNVFFGKWLDFLDSVGHHSLSFEREHGSVPALEDVPSGVDSFASG